MSLFCSRSLNCSLSCSLSPFCSLHLLSFLFTPSLVLALLISLSRGFLLPVLCCSTSHSLNLPFSFSVSFFYVSLLRLFLVHRVRITRHECVKVEVAEFESGGQHQLHGQQKEKAAVSSIMKLRESSPGASYLLAPLGRNWLSEIHPPPFSLSPASLLPPFGESVWEEG